MFSLFRRGKARSSDADDSKNGKKNLKKGKSKNNGSQQDGDAEEDERKKFVNVRYRQWLLDAIHGIPRPRFARYDPPDLYPASFLCLPPAMIQCCPWLLEESCVCTLVGRIGCCSSDEMWARNAVMRYALFLNQVAILLGVFVCLSISDSNYELLRHASLARAELTPTPDNFFSQPITLDVGLKAVAIDNPNTGVRGVVRFDHFCGILGNGLEKYLQDPTEQICQKCADVQIQTVVGLIVAVVSIVPSMAVNCSRMHKTVDVNCTKVYALFLQCLSLAGFILAYYQFTYSCLRDVFYQGEVGYARNGEVTEFDSITEVVRVDFDWSAGYGMICMYAAFGLRVVDFICNCCIPTPVITRNTYDQKIYEVKVQEIVQAEADPEAGLEKDGSFSEADSERS